MFVRESRANEQSSYNSTLLLRIRFYLPNRDRQSLGTDFPYPWQRPRWSRPRHAGLSDADPRRHFWATSAAGEAYLRPHKNLVPRPFSTTPTDKLYTSLLWQWTEIIPHAFLPSQSAVWSDLASLLDTAHGLAPFITCGSLICSPSARAIVLPVALLIIPVTCANIERPMLSENLAA